MKRFIALVLALSVLCLPMEARRRWVPKAATASAFNIGLSTIAANSDTWGADAAWCYRVQASASGTLQNAFFYADGTNASVQKIAIYGPTDSSSAPTATDLLIGSVSGNITGSGSAGWVSASISSGTVVSGQYYFIVCFVSGASPTQQVKTENATTVYYQVTSGGFASPPANLGGFFGSSGNFGRISAYVTAQ